MTRAKRLIALGAASIVGSTMPTVAQQATPVPTIVSANGRHALIVDGAPFLMLGAQANNSSNYPWALPKVWPMLDRLHVNTLEIPVAWQQVEPVEGRFDFGWVQVLLDQARAHDKRLVLLWFGTWKNTGPSYTPAWVLTDNKRFPRMKKADGSDGGSLSPMRATTLAADKRAFVALIGYLKAHDPQNTVILVQVENETGSYGNPRDFAPDANKLFEQKVPALLARRLGKPAGSWRATFGDQADRAFNTWYIARYVDQIAAAGKAVKPIPMYVNAALAGAFVPPPDPNGVASGGPQWDVIDIWKVAAPSIDAAEPDIYEDKSASYAAYLDHYDRPDNALFVPETGNAAQFARYFWQALGHGALGFAPFGFDDTGYYNYPLGGRDPDDALLDAFASKYALLASAARSWAAIAFGHPTWGCARPDDGAPRSTTMGRWTITAKFGQWMFGPDADDLARKDAPPWAAQPVGGCLVAQLGPDTFLLAGDHVRLRIAPSAVGPRHPLTVNVEQGHFEGDRWTTERVWNGDQTDYGLNFVDRPAFLKVTMGSYD